MTNFPKSLLLILFLFPSFLNAESNEEQKKLIETDNEEKRIEKEEVTKVTKTTMKEGREYIQRKLAKMIKDAKINQVENKQMEIFDDLLALPNANDRYRTILEYCNDEAGIREGESILVEKGLGTISYKLHYEDKKLKIFGIRAENLPKMDLGSNSDPYVKIHLYPGYKTEETKHIDNELNPKFKETFEFENVDLKNGFLMFIIYDKDIKEDDVIGKVIQPLNILKEGAEWNGENIHIQRPFSKKNSEAPFIKEHFTKEAIQQIPNVQKNALKNTKFGQISFEMKFDTKIGVLRIDKIKGHQLKAKDKKLWRFGEGTSDPYVEFYIFPGFEKRSTETIKKELNPVFKSEISFLIDPSELSSKTLVILIIDKDVISKDDPIGQLAIELKNYKFSEEKRIKINGKNGNLEYPSIVKEKLPFDKEQIEFELMKQRGEKIKDITAKNVADGKMVMDPKEMGIHFRLFKQCVENILEKNRPNGLNLTEKRFLKRKMTKELKEFLANFLLPRPLFLAQRIKKLMEKKPEGDVRGLLEIGSTESWEDLEQAKYYQRALSLRQMSNFRLLDFIPEQAPKIWNGISEFLNERFSGKKDQKLEKLLEKKKNNSKNHNLGQIVYKLDYEPNGGKLHVFIVEAKGLPIKDDKTNSSDPYIKLRVLPDFLEGKIPKIPRQWTITQPTNLNPVYNANFIFEKIENLKNKILKLSVYDSDEDQRDDPIGQLEIELDQINWEERALERAKPHLKEEDFEIGFIQPKDAGYLKYAMIIQTPKYSGISASTLHFKILEVWDLGLKNAKTLNPYVEINLLGSQIALGRTKTVKNTLHAEFVYPTKFDCQLENSKLEKGIVKFSIYHETLSLSGKEKKIIGAVYISLKKFKEENPSKFKFDDGDEKWAEIEPAFGKINFQIGYNFEKQKVIINMKEARNLASKDPNGKSDPYVKYSLIMDKNKAEEKVGKKMEKNLDPVFNETIEFDTIVPMKNLKGKMLKFVFYDKDETSADDPIGQIIFGLEKIYNSEIWKEKQQKFEEWKNEHRGIKEGKIIENGKEIGKIKYEFSLNVFENGGNITLTIGELSLSKKIKKLPKLEIEMANENGDKIQLVAPETYLKDKQFSIPSINIKKLVFKLEEIGIVEISMEKIKIDAENLGLLGYSIDNWMELEEFEQEDDNWAKKKYEKMSGKYIPVKEKELKEFVTIANEMDKVEENGEEKEEEGQKRKEYFGQKILQLLRQKNREWLNQILILRHSIDLDEIVAKMSGNERRKALQMIDRLTGYGKWRNALNLKRYDQVYAHSLRKMLHIENAAQLTFFNDFVNNYGEYVDDFMGRLAGNQELYHFEVDYMVVEQKKFFVIPEEEDRLAVNITLPAVTFKKERENLLIELEKGLENDAEMNEELHKNVVEKKEKKKDKNEQSQNGNENDDDENGPKNLVPLTKSVFLSDLLYSINEKFMDRLNLIILGRVRQLSTGGIKHQFVSNQKYIINVEENGEMKDIDVFENIGEEKEPNIELIKKEHFEAAVLLFRANYLALAIALQMWPIRKAEADGEKSEKEIEKSGKQKEKSDQKRKMENLEDLKKVEEGRGILYGQIVEDRAWPVEKEKHFWDMSERLKIKLEKIDRKLLMNFNHQFNIEGFNGEYETHYMQIGFEMLQKLGYNFYENLVDQMVIEKITMLEKLRDELTAHNEEDNEFVTVDEVDISEKHIQLFDAGKTVVGTEKMDKTVVGTEKMDKTVVGTEKMDKTVVGTEKMDKTVVGTEKMDKTVVGEEKMDKTVVGAEKMDKTVVGAEKMDKTVVGAEKAEKLNGIEKFIQNKFNWLNEKVKNANRKAMRRRSRFARFFFRKLHGFMGEISGLFTGSTPRIRFFFRTFTPLPYYGFKLAKLFVNWGRKMVKNLWAMLKGKLDQLRFKAELHDFVVNFEGEFKLNQFKKIEEWSEQEAKKGTKDEDLIKSQEEFAKLIDNEEIDKEVVHLIGKDECFTEKGGMKRNAFAFLENTLMRNKRKFGKKKWSSNSSVSSGNSGGGNSGGGKTNAVSSGGGGHSDGTTWTPGGQGNKQATIFGGKGSGKNSSLGGHNQGGEDSSFWDHKAPLMVGWVGINSIVAITMTGPAGYIFWNIKCEKGQVWYKQLDQAFKQFGQIMKQKAKNAIYFLKAVGIKMGHKMLEKLDPELEFEEIRIKKYIAKKQKENGDNLKLNGQMYLESKCGMFISISIGIIHLAIFIIGIIIIYSM